MKIRDRIQELRRVKASELFASERNWRIHPEAQQSALKGVLAEIGYADALIAREAPNGDLVLIDGHLRKETTPDMEVPVLIVDLDEDEANKLLTLLDPLAAMAETDVEALGSLLQEVQTDDDGLAGMLDELAEQEGLDVFAPGPEELQDPEPQIDRAAELQKEWGTATGQLWVIPSKTVKPSVYGSPPVVSPHEHRVLCGDCREPADMARLCVGKVNGCFTSPPYAEQRKEQYGGTPADKYVAWWEAVQANVREVLADDGSFFVNIKPHCEDGERVLYVFDLVLAMKRRWGWRFVDELSWTRQGVPGRWPNRFKNGWEPVYHFTTTEAIKMRHEFVTHASDDVYPYSPDNPKAVSGSGLLSNPGTGVDGQALPNNVIHVPTGGRQTSGAHAAAFPVGLPSFFIKAFSDPADTWLDPFLGSGTTMVGCENLGRIGVGLEISPAYVAVILQRLKDLGLQPRLDNPRASEP